MTSAASRQGHRVRARLELEMERKKLSESLIVKLGVSFLLLALLFWTAGLRRVGEELLLLEPWWFLASVVLVFTDAVLRCLNWSVLLRSQEIRIPFKKLLYIHATSNFFGFFLPTSLGADLIKMQQLGRVTSRVQESISSLLMQNLVNLVGLCILTAAGMTLTAQASGLSSNQVFWRLVGMMLLCVGVVSFGVATPATWSLASRALARIPEGKLSCWLTRFFEIMLTYSKAKRALIVSASMGLLSPLLGILVPFIAARALGLHMTILPFLVFVPLIHVLTMIPVSFGGLGVREGAYVYFFAPLGVGASEALGISLFSFAVSMTLPLVGGLIYVLGNLLSWRSISVADVQSAEMDGGLKR